MARHDNLIPWHSFWYVYIVRCADGTLYTGVTTDVERRVDEHNGSKKGAKYTRDRQPVVCVYTERCDGRSEALKREYRVKKLSRAGKEGLIK